MFNNRDIISETVKRERESDDYCRVLIGSHTRLINCHYRPSRWLMISFCWHLRT